MKLAFRQLLKNPGFIEVAGLALALGIGPGELLGAHSPAAWNSFLGAGAGEETTIFGIRLCWCPPGKFVMGSPRNEPERRPGEDQVEVTLTKGFWMAKYEARQGDWKRVMGELPEPLTEELPEGDNYPVGNVNFAEAEAFCRKLTELGHQSGELPKDWEFRLPGGADPDLYSAESTAVLNRTGDRSRVRRGGAWTDDGWPCRSAFRLRFEPHRRYDHIGFRVVVVRL